MAPPPHFTTTILRRLGPNLGGGGGGVLTSQNTKKGCKLLIDVSIRNLHPQELVHLFCFNMN